MIAVVGGGSIGVAWAIVFARAGHSVASTSPTESAGRSSRRGC